MGGYLKKKYNIYIINEGEGGLYAPGKRGVTELVTDKYTTGPALWFWQLMALVSYQLLPHLFPSPC